MAWPPIPRRSDHNPYAPKLTPSGCRKAPTTGAMRPAWYRRSSVRAGLLLLLVSCGRLGFEPIGNIGGDGGIGDGDWPGQCPATYDRQLGTSRYRIIDAPGMQWLEAELACESDGAGTHLAVINDEGESFGSTDVIVYDEVWVGASQLAAAGTWRFVTGAEATYLDWGVNYPMTGVAQDCVLRQWFTGSPDYRNDPCNMVFPALCECDGIPADPAAF